jgi:antirestriction protein ArdC
MKGFHESVQALLHMFESKTFPEQVAWSIIRRDQQEADIPSDAWSACNRLIMRVHGHTDDARTYLQWKSVGRHVNKGAKAFYIFAPIIKKEIDKNSGKEKTELRGFKPMPVFAIEDTAGENIVKAGYKPKKLPPLVDAAKALGFSVNWEPMGNRPALGFYRPASKSITLHAKDSTVFYHELAHAVHDTIEPLCNVDNDYAEVVAELTAAVLCVMTGAKGYEKQSWQYLKRFTHSGDDKATLKAISSVLNMVERIINIIVKTA